MVGLAGENMIVFKKSDPFADWKMKSFKQWKEDVISDL